MSVQETCLLTTAIAYARITIVKSVPVSSGQVLHCNVDCIICVLFCTSIPCTGVCNVSHSHSPEVPQTVTQVFGVGSLAAPPSFEIRPSVVQTRSPAHTSKWKALVNQFHFCHHPRTGYLYSHRNLGSVQSSDSSWLDLQVRGLCLQYIVCMHISVRVCVYVPVYVCVSGCVSPIVCKCLCVCA